MQVKKLLSFFIWLGELYYLVTDKTRYFNNCPIDSMGEEEIREFLLYQLDSGKSSSTVNIYNSALRFIFGAVLGKKSNYQRIPRRRHYRGLPAIMSKDEIVRFFSAIDNLRDKAIFETITERGCDSLKLPGCVLRTLTANKCVSLCITGKEAKIAILCFPNKILRFFGSIGSNTGLIIRKVTCFTPEENRKMS